MKQKDIKTWQKPRATAFRFPSRDGVFAFQLQAAGLYVICLLCSEDCSREWRYFSFALVSLLTRRAHKISKSVSPNNTKEDLAAV